MPAKKRRQLSSKSRSRKLFVVSAEGAKTEREYFSLLAGQQSMIQVKTLPSRDESSPSHVLDRMQRYRQRERLDSQDEAWLVVDKNDWVEKQLAPLHAWAQKQKNYGLALSNPNFEYWLLLHFEDGTGIASKRDCMAHLKKHLPNYDKGIDPSRITLERVADAIRRARQRDNPPCPDWPRHPGCTTVYRLVEKILKA